MTVHTRTVTDPNGRIRPTYQLWCTLCDWRSWTPYPSVARQETEAHDCDQLEMATE